MYLWEQVLNNWRLYLTGKVEAGREFKTLDKQDKRVSECTFVLFVFNLAAKGCWIFENRVFRSNERSFQFLNNIFIFLGASINTQTEETQETALTLACCGGFTDVAEFLIKAGADIEQGASTPLMEAAQEGHLDLVR